MAMRIEKTAEVRKTSNSTSASRKYRSSLSSTSAALRIPGMAGRRYSGFLHQRLPVFVRGLWEGFSFSRRIGDGSAHEINPNGQSCLAAGFIVAQRLLLVEADPHATSNAG